MVELWGLQNDSYQEKVGESFLDHFSESSERLIATFDTEKMAKKYIKNSRLKKPRHESFRSEIVFRQSSLLWCCYAAEIKLILTQPKYPPHNPKI